MTLLYYALFLLLGCGAALSSHFILLMPLLALMVLSKKPLQGIILFSAAILFTNFRYPSTEFETLEGYGLFNLEKVAPSQSPFQKNLAIKGTFKTFYSENKIYQNIPACIFLNKLPEMGSSWVIEGRLEKKNPFQFVFKPLKHAPWQEISSFSLARLRHEIKESVAKFFRRKMHNRQTGAFFASMATGNIDDRLLAMEFRKVGLGHILAISGLHFALIAALFGFILRLLFPPKGADCLLLAILTLYFLYLGPTPSVLRAYVMISLFLLGLIIGRRSNPFNLLGAALLIELFYDPLTITEISFQLSFLATFALLAFYKPMYTAFEKLFPKRSIYELRQMAFLDLHGYLFIGFLRKSLALTLAVQLTTLPLVFYTFKSFSLLSIIYNLILPPFLFLSLALLPFSMFPPIAYLNDRYTSWVLRLIANPPELLNFKLYVKDFPLPLLFIFLMIIFILGLTKREKTA